ncbi:hypothetical protein MUP51_04615 [Candidatus Bathyarchaeota archaeon]|nr:hypothetical protein [Candidatus Bathyarchaeota archaeon]
MKIIRMGLMVIILLLIITPAYCNASITAEDDQSTALELAEIFNHVFIVNVASKIVTNDRTYYVFNVIEYLKEPVNSSTIFLTAYGGSEIAVTPSTTFYLGLNYLFFCDEINEESSITGNHYQYMLLNSVDPEEIQNIRKSILAEKAAYVEGSVATPEIAIEDREREQPVEPLINPPTKSIYLDLETAKENRANDNTLLTIVYLCIAGIYIILIPGMKNGLK